MKNLNVGNDFAFQNRKIEDDRDKAIGVVHKKDEPGGKAEGKAGKETAKEEKGKTKKAKAKAAAE